jgi:hypothetical protein
VRGQPVLLDSDLAALYEVATKRFDEAVAICRVPSPNMGPSWPPPKLDALERSVAALDSDTRQRFEQVYEAILGSMSQAAKRQ